MTFMISKLTAEIKNGFIRKKETIKIDYSACILPFLDELVCDGFFRNYRIIETNNKPRKIVIFLKYNSFLIPSIIEMSSVSKSERYKKFKVSNINE